MAAGLYIHIPFCFSKCPYCDFYSTKYTAAAADAFAEKLGGQMQDYTGSFDTVYFGGGTPSILEPRVLTGILQAVRDHFAIDPAAEITVECNPSKDLTGDMEQAVKGGARFDLQQIGADVGHLHTRNKGKGFLHEWQHIVACKVALHDEIVAR